MGHGLAPPKSIFRVGSNICRIGSPSDSNCKSLTGQGWNPICRVGSDMRRIWSPSESRCQSLHGQAQFPRQISLPEPHITSGIGYLSYRVAFGFQMQEPDWSGWESHIPCGIQYVLYRVAFGFQIPDLEWPGAAPPIDWAPSLRICWDRIFLL
jgi:hypothetical protein